MNITDEFLEWFKFYHGYVINFDYFANQTEQKVDFWELDESQQIEFIELWNSQK